MVAKNPTVRLLKIDEVMVRVGLSRSVVYAKMRKGSFPLPVYAAWKAPRWRSDVIARWIDGLPVDRAAAA